MWFTLMITMRRQLIILIIIFLVQITLFSVMSKKQDFFVFRLSWNERLFWKYIAYYEK